MGRRLIRVPAALVKLSRRAREIDKAIDATTDDMVKTCLHDLLIEAPWRHSDYFASEPERRMCAVCGAEADGWSNLFRLPHAKESARFADDLPGHLYADFTGSTREVIKLATRDELWPLREHDVRQAFIEKQMHAFWRKEPDHG